MTAQIELKQTEQLPYEIGRFSFGWRLFLILLLALTGLGIFAYSQQLIQGEAVTGMRDIGTMGGSPWGIYIAFVIYFVGIAFAGITVAMLIPLMGLTHLRPIARMAEVLTVVTLILGAIGVVLDVGQPARALVNLLQYARPSSPFFGTFALDVAGFLLGSVVYLYLDSRRDAAVMARQPGRWQGFYRRWAAGYQNTPAEQARHRRARFWLAVAILPLMIVAHSTLGFVFGLQVGRPGWFGTLQAPGFLVLAGLSGIGMLIIVAAVLRQALNLEKLLPVNIFRWLSNLMMVLIGVYLYFMVVEWLTTAYAAHEQEGQLMESLLIGEYAFLFWTAVVCLVVPMGLLIWQYVQKSYSLSLIVLSGILVNVAAIAKRYLIVVPSQTHGSLLPYAAGSYSPSWVEIAVIVGMFALGGLLFTLFLKLFPIMELTNGETKDDEAGNVNASSGRAPLVLGMIFAGFALQIVSYFFLAAPLGQATSEIYSNPRLPFAPLIFIVGIALVFLAAIVYEVFPKKESTA